MGIIEWGTESHCVLSMGIRLSGMTTKGGMAGILLPIFTCKTKYTIDKKCTGSNALRQKFKYCNTNFCAFQWCYTSPSKLLNVDKSKRNLHVERGTKQKAFESDNLMIMVRA